jgi:hydroxymethylpyrimidine/phosphomethylpyrimidine kinase
MSQFVTLGKQLPVALSIAGFDPSGGAGILADLRTFAAHRLYGMAAISAITVQSTLGIRRVEPVSAEILRETLKTLFEDEKPQGIKIGMVGSEENINCFAPFLVQIYPSPIVLDPVLRSSSGSELLSGSALEAFRRVLLPRVQWLTPNLEEAAKLTGLPVQGPDGMVKSAHKLQKIARESGGNGLNVVVTGGHRNPPDDLLLTAEGAEHWLPGEHIETSATHGTGCTFSSALLANLILGRSPLESVRAAKQFVRTAMERAYPVGKGKGPLNQLFALDDIESNE